VTIAMPRTALRLVFAGATPLETKVLHGARDEQGNPTGGWFSGAYGKLTATSTLCVATEAELPQEIVTRLKIAPTGTAPLP
jgi:hypothetical protein